MDAHKEIPDPEYKGYAVRIPNFGPKENPPTIYSSFNNIYSNL
jgi:hypothetical protein